MADLLVIVPSRGRPHNIAALWDEAWLPNTTDAAHLLVAVDQDDPALFDYQDVCNERGIHWEVGGRLRLVGTLNAVARAHAPDYFALAFIGDDHRPRTARWNERIVSALREMGTGIVYGDDLVWGPDLPTAAAMTSDIVQTLGWMAPPCLEHLWVDNAWKELGQAVDRLRYLPDVVIEHMHPIVGKAAQDERYDDVNSPRVVGRDSAAYEQWKANDLPRDAEKLRALL
ncbi:hypothetical protein [Acrocarpospora sp. B8E8]|uniref:hypothetical protein n=1 Tax=Acrocarpospora sp. B8E8 TaxID=3153572 RepID=UPI00325EF92C